MIQYDIIDMIYRYRKR